MCVLLLVVHTNGSNLNALRLPLAVAASSSALRSVPCGAMRAVPNLFKVYKHDEDPIIEARGRAQSLLLVACVAAVFAAYVGVSLTTTSLVTVSTPSPSLETYLTLKSPTCFCSTSGETGFSLGKASSIRNDSTAYAQSFYRNICRVITKPDVLRIPSGEGSQLDANNVFGKICITMQAMENIVITNAQSFDVPLSTLLSNASFTSLAINTWRTSLQPLATLFGSLVNTYTIPGSINYIEHMSLDAELPLKPIPGLLAGNKSNFNYKQFSTSDRIIFTPPVPAPSGQSYPPFSMRAVLSSGVDFYFGTLPLAKQSIFTATDFATLSPSLLSINYAAYYAACAPSSCSTTELYTIGPVPLLLASIGVVGGAATSASTAIAALWVLGLWAYKKLKGDRDVVRSNPVSKTSALSEVAAPQAAPPLSSEANAALGNPASPWVQHRDGEQVWYVHSGTVSGQMPAARAGSRPPPLAPPLTTLALTPLSLHPQTFTLPFCLGRGQVEHSRGWLSDCSFLGGRRVSTH